MKKYLLFSLILLIAIPLSSVAQTSAGKCWYIDYLIWDENQPQLHIDCGNNDAFNVGDELTIELWIRAYTFGENRKVLGKVGSDGEVFDNGYVLGFGNLNPYAEIWNPNLQQIPYPNAGPIPKDSAFIHMACTYSSNTAKLTDYVNGNLVGQVDVFPPNPIAANDAIFLIGSAPWDALSFQFYGALDEVRIWNKARTQEQISEFMYKELKGDEEGLVAYYNFNEAQDSIVPDASLNDNTGELRNSDDPSWSWADSYIPVGNQKMYDMVEPIGAWYGKSPELWNYATTNNGLSAITDIGEKVFDKYLVFGQNNLSGTSTENAPEGAGNDFERMSREWYVNSGGSFNTDMYFNMLEASGGGSQLPTGGSDSSYVLMTRSTTNDEFRAISYPTNIIGNILVFEHVALADKYYCVGYSSTPIPITPDGIVDQKLSQIKTGPNPANDLLVVQNASGSVAKIFSLNGQLLVDIKIQSNHQTINLESLLPGMYLLQYQLENKSISKKIVINR